MARVTSGHSVFDQASDRFTAPTGYSPEDGTKPSVKVRFSMWRSGTPDPYRSSIHDPSFGDQGLPGACRVCHSCPRFAVSLLHRRNQDQSSLQPVLKLPMHTA